MNFWFGFIVGLLTGPLVAWALLTVAVGYLAKVDQWAE